jgi:hypothetical protein
MPYIPTVHASLASLASFISLIATGTTIALWPTIAATCWAARITTHATSVPPTNSATGTPTCLPAHKSTADRAAFRATIATTSAAAPTSVQGLVQPAHQVLAGEMHVSQLWRLYWMLLALPTTAVQPTSSSDSTITTITAHTAAFIAASCDATRQSTIIASVSPTLSTTLAISTITSTVASSLAASGATTCVTTTVSAAGTAALVTA